MLAFPEGDVLFAKPVTNQFVIQSFDFIFLGGEGCLSEKLSKNDAKMSERLQTSGPLAREGRQSYVSFSKVRA